MEIPEDPVDLRFFFGCEPDDKTPTEHLDNDESWAEALEIILKQRRRTRGPLTLPFTRGGGGTGMP